MNNYLKFALLSLACASMTGSFTSCKDYDDDINNLQGQIDGIKVDLDKLREIVDKGVIITNVTSSADGVTISTSDNKTYTLTNGKDGANGTAWTIGADGYWYKDGSKTDYRAIGEEGKVGPQGPKGDKGDTGAAGPAGPAGATGATGASGEYYVPNATTGNFDIYQDGKFVKDSGISWRPAAEENNGVTAVFDGTVLTLSGVKDVNGKDVPVAVNVGNQIGSLAFVPTVLSSKVQGFATTTDPFYHITNYYDETKFNATTKAFIPQAWDKSNVVVTEYRVSPEDALVSSYSAAEFINRAVTSRAAAGDLNTLMNVSSYDITAVAGTGVLPVKATYNISGIAPAGKNDLVAFQLQNGKDVFTSDYIAPASSAIVPVIVDPLNANKAFYTRNYALGANNANETDAQIKNDVDLSDPENLYMVYTKTLNLKEHVELYCTSLSKTIKALGFTESEISYEFALPKEYLAVETGAQAGNRTNQQWFVELNDGTLSVNSANLGSETSAWTAAIGRTPVVRVDAFMKPNLKAGNANPAEQLVASSYIKVKIIEKPTTTPDDINIDHATAQQLYRSLGSTWTELYQVPWTDINTKVYGATGLTSQNFWKNYGGTNSEYTVSLYVDGKNDAIATGTGVADQAFTFTAAEALGFQTNVTFGKFNTQTSHITYSINNLVHTQHYADFKQYAKNGVVTYKVKIAIKSNDKKYYPDVTIEETIPVTDNCTYYPFNPLYQIDGKHAVQTKGKAVGGMWKLTMDVAEVFDVINSEDVFAYYNKPASFTGNYATYKPAACNVTAIEFAKKNAAETKFTYDPTTQNVALNFELENDYTANMQYTQTLVNGETCVYDFDILFVNPFKNGSTGALTLSGNKIGGATANAAELVKVIQNNNAAGVIYAWDAVKAALELSQDPAISVYKLDPSMVSVEYSFVQDADYNAFASHLVNLNQPGGTVFAIDADGVVSFDNLGAELQREYKVTVKAVVTFDKISKVTCTIPLTITTSAK